MRQRFFKRNIDLWVAGTVLAASAFMVCYAYGEIISNRVSTGLVFERIAQGNSRYAIVQDQRCVGVMKLFVEDEELLRFRIDATMAIAYGGAPQTLRIVSDAFFNPLGQLIRSRSELSLAGLRADFSTQDVHPVRVAVSTGGAGMPTRYDYQIPGPIMVRELEPSSYVFEYPQLQAVGPVSFSRVFEGLAAETKLGLKELTNETTCEESNRSTVDLSGAMRRLQAVVPALSKLLQSGKMPAPVRSGGAK